MTAKPKHDGMTSANILFLVLKGISQLFNYKNKQNFDAKFWKYN